MISPDEPVLTPERLRDLTRATWLDMREDPERSDVVGYLAVAYDQLERACKAAANATAGGSGTEQAT